MDIARTELDKLNSRALNRFEEIKNKMKFNLGSSVVQDISKEKNTEPITLTQNKVDEMMSQPINSYPENQRDQLVAVAGEVEFVDNTFDFINSLELPINLAMAVGLIISGAKTKDRNDLEKAIVAIEGGF